MGVGDVKHFEGRRGLLRRYRRLDRRFLDRREGHLPLVQRIKRVVARIADHEAADLRRAHVHLLQHVDHFSLDADSMIRSNGLLNEHTRAISPGWREVGKPFLLLRALNREREIEKLDLEYIFLFFIFLYFS